LIGRRFFFLISFNDWGAGGRGGGGSGLPFLAFFLSCFFGCSSSSDSSAFLRHSLFYYLSSDSFPYWSRLGEEEVETGVESGRAFAGHVAGFPASEAGSFLPQLVTDLRSEFREVLGANRSGFLLIDVHWGRLCDRDCLGWKGVKPDKIDGMVSHSRVYRCVSEDPC